MKKNDPHFLPKKGSAGDQGNRSHLSIYQIVGIFILSNLCVIGLLFLIYLLF